MVPSAPRTLTVGNLGRSASLTAFGGGKCFGVRKVNSCGRLHKFAYFQESVRKVNDSRSDVNFTSLILLVHSRGSQTKACLIMLSVQKKYVPDYLKSSPLFGNTFQETEDDTSAAELTIDIPADCFKLTPVVHNESDMFFLLRTVRFWLIPEHIEHSEDVFAFALSNRESIDRAAVEFGRDFPFLVQLGTAVTPSTEYATMGNAARFGMLIFVKYLRSNGHDWNSCTHTNKYFTSIAAANGHANCLQYALENQCECIGDECKLAARGGHVDCIKIARAHGCSLVLEDCKTAVRLGHVPVVKYFVDVVKMKTALRSDLCGIAVWRGNIHMLQYLHSVGCPCNIGTMNLAASFDHLECVRFLHETGCPWSEKTSFIAVRSGSIECVRYMHSLGCVWDERALQKHDILEVHIARGEDDNDDDENESGPEEFVSDPEKLLVCFQFAAEHGCPVTSLSYALAAYVGLPTFIEYLCDHGVPWDPLALLAQVRAAAGAGNQYTYTIDDAFLQYTNEWRSEAPLVAAEYQHLECLQILLQRGCPCGTIAYLVAIHNDDMDCVQCLHAHNVPWDATTTSEAAKYDRVRCLEYLLNHGCPCDTSAYIVAVKEYHLQSVQYLHVNGVEWDATVTTTAVKYNRPDILEYLLKHQCPVDPAMLQDATLKDRTSCVKVLKAAGIQWDTSQAPDISVCLEAVRGCELSKLRRAVDHGCAVDAILCVEAVKLNKLEMLKYLHEAGCPWDARTTTAAIERDLYQLLHYAVSNGCPVSVAEEVLGAAPRCALVIASHRASVEK